MTTWHVIALRGWNNHGSRSWDNRKWQKSTRGTYCLHFKGSDQGKFPVAYM